MKRDLISVLDMKDYLNELIEEAIVLKAKWKNREILEPLKHRSIAMIFEKPSTRTRVSFETAMTQLGGHALYLNPNDMQLGRGETIADTAKVLSRYVDAIVYRAYKHEMVVELAQNASVPVINALDNLEHPCQCAADLMTIKEHKGDFKGLKLVYVGDGNNVCNSLLLGSAIVGMNMTACCPSAYYPNKEILETAIKLGKKNGANIEVVEKPEEAVKDADIIYTDVWVSMGDEAEKEKREKIFKPYQVNMKLLKKAKKDCIFMHCLPAHRGQEVTDEVIDSKHSVVFDEAENRLHVQKAILLRLIEH